MAIYFFVEKVVLALLLVSVSSNIRSDWNVHSAHGLSLNPVDRLDPYNTGPPVPAAKAPNPRQQLQRYEENDDEYKKLPSLFGIAFARSSVRNQWNAVGYVRSVLSDPTRTSLYTSAFGSIQRQNRLIVEYACGLHRELRQSKKEMELGVLLLDDERVGSGLTPYHDRVELNSRSVVQPVPHPASHDVNDQTGDGLAECGFVGLLSEQGYQSKLYREHFERRAALGATVVGRANFDIGNARASIDKRDEESNKTSHSADNSGVLSPEYYKSVYDNKFKTPWDVGRPQPTVVRAYERGELRGRILDAGCGAGENSVFLSGQYGVDEVVGFDLAPGAIETARQRLSEAAKMDSITATSFFVASCTDVADYHSSSIGKFDIVLDSGLLHCLSDTDAVSYVRQIAQLVVPGSGRAFVGCFSTENPDPWENPRRLDREYLNALFCRSNGWEVVDVRETWWARPPERGSSQGSFCMALWMQARRLPTPERGDY